ncbi:hypothetical protein [Cronobacter muytjensii]|uniref:hypothetical protein n=1 Tax=Cronobacter muytjensii TaxID=413501 RepID=UPI003CEA584C
MANGTMSSPLHISLQPGCENRSAGALRLPAQFYLVFLSRMGKRSAPTRRDIPFIKRRIAKPYSPRCSSSLFFISPFIAHLCRTAAPSRIPFLLKNAALHNQSRH